MKRLLAASLFVLAAAVVPSQAAGPGCGPFTIDTGAKAWCNVNCYGAGVHIQAGPWYSYWPLEAHFQVPAPTGYPYWPAPMTSNVPPLPAPHPGLAYPGPVQLPPARPPAHVQTGWQPVSYYANAPSYWYAK
jgi:hypothetical protein